jgi:LmbE family N-acetylglucosaminyl deacetylase
MVCGASTALAGSGERARIPRMISRFACTTAATALLGLLSLVPTVTQEIPVERGATRAALALRKVATLASLMHTTAHPDDEQGGMLAMVSHGLGARTTLLTLNRGESGDNALGPELFDSLGLIRTEELRISNRYYGVDEQYYTTAVDYGFSKRLDEAIEKWGREDVLRGMVRAIRRERPLVIVSRWQGNARDGHGQHQAAGLLSQEAFKAAGDSSRFAELAKEGLRPWQPLKLYMGGARENEPWQVRLETGIYDPVIGDSFSNLARYGLSFQRSQNSGRFAPGYGPMPMFFVRLEPAPPPGGPEKEPGFFDGIDTSWRALARTLRVAEPDGAAAALGTIADEVEAARKAFSMNDPSASAPALARGLAAVARARTLFASHPDAVHVLDQKKQQFEDAIAAALALEMTAVAVPQGTAEPTGPFAMFAPAPTMAPVVAGQGVDVRVTVTARNPAGNIAATLKGLSVILNGSDESPPLEQQGPLAGRPVTETLKLELPPDLAPARPHVSRASIAVSHYTVAAGAEAWRPSPPPLVAVRARIAVGDVTVDLVRPVQRRESLAPYGYALRELAVVPALSVAVSPKQAMIPSGSKAGRIPITVRVSNNRGNAAAATASLELPSGWKSDPMSADLQVPPGGQAETTFTVTAPAAGAGSHALTATVTSAGQSFKEGYEFIAYRDLETRYIYRPSVVNVAAVDVAVAPNLRVGYVMGIGDENPSAIRQLGAAVEMLDAAALASAPLDRFDAILVGTRAYAVRPDLRSHNARLIDYAKNGGNLIVFYNTQELDPAAYAPFPGKLPGNAEEVSEEDAAVTILAPQHKVFTSPNRITAKDFEGWVEQRGSKFWTEWDAAYTPLVECHDRGQAPQRGGWLHARVGKGHYSYVAYAFHRQLPYGVPGAYRLLANLISLRD